MGLGRILAIGIPLTNYSFALARRQALMLVAGQVAIAGVVALICALMIDAAAGAAAAIGGGIGAVASLAQVASGFRSSSAGDAPAIARGFYRGEAMKIAVTVLLFVLALRGRHLAAGPLFAGYVATFVAYWVALWRSVGTRGA
jgi:ATP synthase protein I